MTRRERVLLNCLVVASLLACAPALADYVSAGVTYFFARTDNTNAIRAGGSSTITQSSGGGGSSVPIGFQGSVNITGGTWNHAVGLLGWNIATTVGDWRGSEGRVDANVAGVSGYGLSALAYLNGGGGGNSGTNLISLSGVCGLTSGAATGSTCTGMVATATGAATNYNAVFGVGTAAGDNGLVLFKGYRTPITGASVVDFSVSDTLGAFYEDFSDAHLTGVDLRLNDTAGASSWTLMKSDFTTAAQITSAGAETINTMSVTNTGSGYGVVAASNSTKSALSITASAAPSTTSHNGDIYVDSTSKDLKISDGAVYRPVVMGVSVTFSASTTATFTVPSGATLCGCQDTAALLTTGERCTISGTTATATDGTSNSALHICWFF